MQQLPISVGISSRGYPERRNFLDLPFRESGTKLASLARREVTFRKIYDWNRLIVHLNWKLTGEIDYKRLNRFNDFGLQKVDLYHFFNGITPVRRPWIVTFETSLPRLDPCFEQGWEWLASDYCKKIIAISERAKDAQLRLLEDHPSYADAIKAKMIVASPPQVLHVSSENRKNFSEPLRFVFVGGHFYHKGGIELVRAFEKIRQMRLPVTLTIVSSM